MNWKAILALVFGKSQDDIKSEYWGLQRLRGTNSKPASTLTAKQRAKRKARRKAAEKSRRRNR